MLRDAARRIARRFGPLGWWPGETPLEVCVGAVLTQNTSWKGVELAIGRLRAAGVLSGAAAMLALPEDRLADLIRPAGYFRVKARRLRALLRWLEDRGGGDVAAALAGPLPRVREDLLTVHGVGRETADSILLYAANRRVFVIDAYTRRIVGRHRWMDPDDDYDALRLRFEEALPRSASAWNEAHAGIVTVGKEFCRPRPRCTGCPLEPLLPPGGPAGCGVTPRRRPRASPAPSPRAGGRPPSSRPPRP